MPIRRADLPSFASLLAFEAVERLGSFTAASKELRVSQAAVSQKVGELEAWLNARLVKRTKPHIGFTEDGNEVARAVRSNIAGLSSALHEIRLRHDRRKRVTLAATNAFALYWLGSRLQEFYAAHPELELNLLTADTTVFADRRDFDLGIVFSDRAFSGFESRVLCDESIVAVAAPSYLEGRPDDLEAGQWDQETLLSLHADEETWMDWLGWFERVGIAPAAPHRVEQFSSYVTLLQATIAGRGVAMGWQQMVAPLIDRGELAKVGRRIVRSAGQYRLISRKDGGGANWAATSTLHDWLLQMAERSEASIA